MRCHASRGRKPASEPPGGSGERQVLLKGETISEYGSGEFLAPGFPRPAYGNEISGASGTENHFRLENYARRAHTNGKGRQQTASERNLISGNAS